MTDQRLANGSRNTDPRSLIVSRRHRRQLQRRVVGPMNVARSFRNETGCSSKSTDKRSLRPENKQRISVGYARCPDQQTSSARDLSLLSLPACFCVYRDTHAPISQMVETFVTIGDDDDGKSAECCHGDNYVR